MCVCVCVCVSLFTVKCESEERSCLSASFDFSPLPLLRPCIITVLEALD